MTESIANARRTMIKVEAIANSTFTDDEKIKIALHMFPKTTRYLVGKQLEEAPDTSWEVIASDLVDFYNTTLSPKAVSLGDEMYLEALKED